MIFHCVFFFYLKMLCLGSFSKNLSSHFSGSKSDGTFSTAPNQRPPRSRCCISLLTFSEHIANDLNQEFQIWINHATDFPSSLCAIYHTSACLPLTRKSFKSRARFISRGSVSGLQRIFFPLCLKFIHLLKVFPKLSVVRTLVP